jgi:hypothetical protein
MLAVWRTALFQSFEATVVLLNACCNVCFPGRNTLVPHSGAMSCNIAVVEAIQHNGHRYSLQVYQCCFSGFFLHFSLPFLLLSSSFAFLSTYAAGSIAFLLG